MLQIAKTLSKEYNHEVFTKEDAKSILQEMEIFLGDSAFSCEPLGAQGRVRLPQNGTEIYCPKCDAITTCHDTSESNEDTSGHRNYYDEEQPTVNWHRRARMCSECGHEFLTGETQESLIDELVTLKQRQSETSNSQAGSSRYDDGSWINHDTSSRIPYAWAHEFIACTAWWLHHPSGPVRAPKHADRIFESEQHGWAIEFGANSFLVETAIKRSLDAVKSLLDTNETGRDELISEIKRHTSGAVSNHYDDEYSGYYPLEGEDMIFGSTSINVDDAAKFILEKSIL